MLVVIIRDFHQYRVQEAILRSVVCDRRRQQVHRNEGVVVGGWSLSSIQPGRSGAEVVLPRIGLGLGAVEQVHHIIIDQPDEGF